MNVVYSCNLELEYFVKDLKFYVLYLCQYRWLLDAM